MTSHRARNRLLIAALVAVAVLLFLFGDNPTLCVVLSALLAGRRALLSGFWVLRHDPVRKRGRICFAFHASTAIWQGAPAAMLTIVALIWAEKFMGRPADVREAVPTLVALFIAIGLSSLLGLAASVAAAVAGVKIWVHPEFEASLQRELNNGDAGRRPFNYGVFVLATSVSVPILLLGSAALVRPAAVWIVPAFLLGSPLMAVAAYRWFASRIFASGPKQYLTLT